MRFTSGDEMDNKSKYQEYKASHVLLSRMAEFLKTNSMHVDTFTIAGTRYQFKKQADGSVIVRSIIADK